MSTHEQHAKQWRKTMAKTLADMTAEEREECVGMWCDNLVSTADNPQPVVLACVQGERCWILHTDLYGSWSCFSLDSVSPRPDLPRAWTPDGEPELAQALAEETWEYIAEWCDNGVWAPIEIEMFDGVFPNLTAARGYIKVAKTRGAYENTRIVRRRVSPPEVINE